MKGMTSEQFKHVQDHVQHCHKFGGYLPDEAIAKIKEKYPKYQGRGKCIKYIDSVYDSRFSDVWSVSFRGLGVNVCFHTNQSLETEFPTLYELVMAFLTGEWEPNNSQWNKMKIEKS